MKAKEIMEMAPYLQRGKYVPRGYKDTFISDAAFARDYDLLFTETILGEDLQFGLLKDGATHAIGIKKSVKENGQASNLVIFKLSFKATPTVNSIPVHLDSARIRQVDSVFTHKDFRNFGIASRVYIALAILKYVIISDTSQFDDGKMLWVKMAKEAHFNSYKIYVLDSDYGLKLDMKKQPMVYDGSNIDDAEIWTSDEDMSGANILLTLVN